MQNSSQKIYSLSNEAHVNRFYGYLYPVIEIVLIKFPFLLECVSKQNT